MVEHTSQCLFNSEQQILKRLTANSTLSYSEGQSMKEIVTDLRAEQEGLDQFLSSLREEQWTLPTPAEGWTIRDSVFHIAYTDERATAVLQGSSTTPEHVEPRDRFIDNRIERRSVTPPEILSCWREIRETMLEELTKCDPKRRFPWVAGDMAARSFATARLMETWAHGLDCYDAVGLKPLDTDRLRHTALLAYMARPYAYQINGFELPSTPLHLELWLPSGTLWTHDPENAMDSIKGQASEFCRVAVRRRHWLDTNLVIKGDEAKRFIEIVQTYAGPPGLGRKPKNPSFFRN